jgi:hypothetical protein
MRRRPVARQFNQVLPRFAVKEAAPYHADGRIRLAPFGKGVFRVLRESEYSSWISLHQTP